MPKLLDLRGLRFGHLTVIGRVARPGVYWLCRCDCGKTKEVARSSLTSGGSKSCGCRKLEGLRRETHGGTKRPEYSVWCGMKDRCTNTRSAAYKNYGGRGITVCDLWLNDFAAFLEDMGPRPTRAHTIERIDNDMGYSPDNCVWATRATQNNNQRPRRLKTHCKRGHPRFGDNFVAGPDGRRSCLACRKILWEQWAATHKRVRGAA